MFDPNLEGCLCSRLGHLREHTCGSDLPNSYWGEWSTALRLIASALRAAHKALLDRGKFLGILPLWLFRLCLSVAAGCVGCMRYIM